MDSWRPAERSRSKNAQCVFRTSTASRRVEPAEGFLATFLSIPMSTANPNGAATFRAIPSRGGWLRFVFSTVASSAAPSPAWSRRLVLSNQSLVAPDLCDVGETQAGSSATESNPVFRQISSIPRSALALVHPWTCSTRSIPASPAIRPESPSWLETAG